MGTNLVVVRPGSPIRRGGGGPGGGGGITTLVQTDADTISKRFPDTVAAVAAVCRGNGDAKLGDITWTTSIIGAAPSYGTITKTDVEAGRFMNADEEKGRARVCCVGRTVIEKLTGDRTTNLVGKDIELNRARFTVIGILKEKGVGAFGQDQDDLVIIPCSTAMRRVFNRTYLSEIDMMCATEADIDLATEQVVSLLRQRHKLRPPFPDNDDFNDRSQSQILQASAQSSGVMTALLGSIAFVSLMVGGIGIMNIMLVSVTERTREIGIRKAVGARRHDILMQFVIEALVIAVMGGFIGIALGVGTVLIITHFLGWNALIQVSSIILSVVVSGAIGLFFGIFPAVRAASLNPIDALRYE
jgi:putative ABC transport system permease protein